jgi:hypothetical protein
VPSVPLLESHSVVVDFFVKFVEEGNGLDDHDIHFLS